MLMRTCTLDNLYRRHTTIPIQAKCFNPELIFRGLAWKYNMNPILDGKAQIRQSKAIEQTARSWDLRRWHSPLFGVVSAPPVGVRRLPQEDPFFQRVRE